MFAALSDMTDIGRSVSLLTARSMVSIFGATLATTSPGHDGSAAYLLRLLIREIGCDHILHGDAHSLIYRYLGIAEAARLAAKTHCSQSRASLYVQTPEFPATNRDRLKSL